MVPLAGFPRLDRVFLQRLACLRDGGGVATVLAARGAAAEEEIRATLRRGGPALSALADEAATLADPRLEGPAHGLVAALSSGEVHRFRLPQQVTTLVAVGSEADIVPIARAFDGARAVGIVDARLDRLRIVEAAHGETRELEGDALASPVDWSEFRGPVRANPLRAVESSSQRERYERRTRVQRSRALKEAGRHVSDLARARGWHVLVIAGDPHVTRELARELPSPYLIPRHLPAWESAGRLVHDLERELGDARRGPAAALSADAHEHRGAYAIGAKAVRAAIENGRAVVVVVDTPALGPESGEVVGRALAHELDVLFADGRLSDLQGVICSLHGPA
jgi:Bacterial archaeo-eukaryotic release factor family 10